MAKAVPKPKKPTTRQAYKNAQQLREVIRLIYRACSLDPNYSGLNSPHAAATALAAARMNTDLKVGSLDTYHRTQIQESLKAERIAAAQGGETSHLHVMVRQAYELMQVLPSWDKLPEGQSENKLRAIQALLKTAKTYHSDKVLDSIRIIVGVKKLEVPEPKPKPKPHYSGVSVPIPSVEVLAETGKPKSPHHQEPVVKDPHSALVWGYHAPYYMIKKGTPITWGAHLVWVDKGFKKPGKTGDKYYVHPGYATQAQKDYHYGQEEGPVLATETHLPDEVELDLNDLEGSEDDGKGEEGIY